MQVYKVKDWDARYENNKSRERDACKFVCVPNKQDGLGLQHVLAKPNGAAIYGIFNLIIGKCSKQHLPRDGWMTQDGRETGTPWAVDDLCLLWRRDASEIEAALQVLSSKEVDWIECLSAREVPAECPGDTLEGRKEGKKGTAAGPPVPVVAADDAEAEKIIARMVTEFGCDEREVRQKTSKLGTARVRDALAYFDECVKSGQKIRKKRGFLWNAIREGWKPAGPSNPNSSRIISDKQVAERQAETQKLSQKHKADNARIDAIIGKLNDEDFQELSEAWASDSMNATHRPFDLNIDSCRAFVLRQKEPAHA